MNVRDLFEKWRLTSLKVKTPFLDMDWNPSDPDRGAAWDLYVELLTRTATQPLADKDGLELSALESVFSIFALTRSTLKTHGSGCSQFTRIAVVILNQIIRPFTSKWHLLSQNGGFTDPQHCKEFRADLENLQVTLRNYAGLLAELANVEDLTTFDTPSI